VPFTSVEVQVGRFDALDLEHRFVRYPAEDHLLFATQDRFATVLTGLDAPRAVRNPRDIDFTWQPRLTRDDLGIGATTAYWIGGLAARDSSPGSLARVEATSQARPGRAQRAVRTGPTPVAAPLPALRQDLVLQPGDRLPTRKRITVDLTNVRRATVDLDRAGMRCGAVVVTTDGRTTVTFTGSRSGRVTEKVTSGASRFRLC